MFAIFELHNARKAIGLQWDRAMVRVGFVVDVGGGSGPTSLHSDMNSALFTAHDFFTTSNLPSFRRGFYTSQA
jgi:hypothetical protein